jgi:hypothetical protein
VVQWFSCRSFAERPSVQPPDSQKSRRGVLKKECQIRFVNSEISRCSEGSVLKTHLPRHGAYLRQRWEEGCRHGRTLLAEIRQRGYLGGHSQLAKLLSPWRQPPAESAPPLAEATAHEEVTPAAVGRQISPQVAAALLSKSPTELSRQQAKIVDTQSSNAPALR